jgi:Kyakuja-Dileera-Zisupton transposase
MDYSLSEGLENSNITGLKRVVLFYDVMCIYCKRLKLRMEESDYLKLPLGIAILHGIGLFHVGGHVWECFSRFSPSFIPGAGQVDGEILESLWSVLNEISPSTQNATISGRVKMLDDHMGDSNFKKMLDIGKSISEQRTGVSDTGL